MNIKRWTSALLGFPLIAAVLIFGNRVVVDIALAVFAFIALNEYFNCIKEKANPIYEVGYASTILIALAHVIKPEIWIMIIPIILLALFLASFIINSASFFAFSFSSLLICSSFS